MTVLAEITELVRREAGIALPAARQTAILAAVDRAAPWLGPEAFLRAASAPGSDRDLVSRLIDEVTVQETAFVRDRIQFEAIAWARLRQAAAAGQRPIRVWSAGCASGEEAYTLAMLAAEAFAPVPPPVEVLGTDISDAALAKAAAGRYRERTMRAVVPAWRDRYFDRQADGSYLVGERLRRLVKFGRHNLARDPIPPAGESGFNLVACKNVLIYFEAPIVGPVIDALRRSLRPGGMLLLGHADVLPRAVPRPARPAAEPEDDTLRRLLTIERPLSRADRLTAALNAADRGDRLGALSRLASLLVDYPLDADAHFVDGLVALAADRPAGAAAALRRALCADASFGLAAFTLGRAYDALGDQPAALRSYGVALRTLNPADDRHGELLQQVEIGDIAAACRVRLGVPP